MRQIISGDELMMVKLTMKAGAVVKHHRHPNEQMTYILKGKIRFTHGLEMEQSTTLCAGMFSTFRLMSRMQPSAWRTQSTLMFLLHEGMTGLKRMATPILNSQ